MSRRRLAGALAAILLSCLGGGAAPPFAPCRMPRESSKRWKPGCGRRTTAPRIPDLEE